MKRHENVRDSMKVLRQKKRVDIPHDDTVVAEFLKKSEMLLIMFAAFVIV